MVRVGTNGATKMTMTANGEQGRCTAKAPSDGRLVSGTMGSGLREKSMAWGYLHGVMALPMMVSGSLARSMALGYATGQCVVCHGTECLDSILADILPCATSMHKPLLQLLTQGWFSLSMLASLTVARSTFTLYKIRSCSRSFL